jgi:hypothetical protein
MAPQIYQRRLDEWAAWRETSLGADFPEGE